MNNKTSLLCSILIIAALFFAGCGPSKKNEANLSQSFVSGKPVSNEKYYIDKKESVVTWKASMQFILGQGHSGYVSISKGELMIARDQLVGGTVEVDMNTIEDEKHGSDNNLVNHLKNPDFFDVEKFPVSTFDIITVMPRNDSTINVTGNLTIKGITLPVTFPATLEVKDGVVRANGKVTIDRTLWDVRYKSGKFFDNLKDDAISDFIEFEMKIVARK